MPVRTPPLIVDKETQEPRYLTPYQQKPSSQPWRVVLTTDLGRKGKLFHSLAEARQFADRVKERNPDADVTVVSRCVGYGPPFKLLDDNALYYMNEQGLFWCPYCRKPRYFTYNYRRASDCCPVCDISIEDFHVRKNNPHFWERA